MQPLINLPSAGIAAGFVPLSSWMELALRRVALLALLFFSAVILNRLAKALTRRLLRKYRSTGLARASQRKQQQARTLADLLLSAFTAIIFAAAFLTARHQFGLKVTPFAAAAGLASLAVGFGGQYLVRDLINGILIVFEDQYVVGDNVRIGDVTGHVEHITLCVAP